MYATRGTAKDTDNESYSFLKHEQRFLIRHSHIKQMIILAAEKNNAWHSCDFDMTNVDTLITYTDNNTRPAHTDNKMLWPSTSSQRYDLPISGLRR